MITPDEIRLLDAKSGLGWTERETERSVNWWMERTQERLVWAAAFQYLGGGAAREDVEEAWAAFYTEILERARRSYRPGGPSFATYALHVCFKNECAARGKRIRRRLSACVSLTASTTESGTYSLDFFRGGDDPHAITERRLMLEEVERFLEEGALSAQQTRVFTLAHFNGMSMEEIAAEVGAEINTVRVWKHRAAAKVRRRLREKGWAN